MTRSLSRVDGVLVVFFGPVLVSSLFVQGCFFKQPRQVPHDVCLRGMCVVEEDVVVMKTQNTI